MGSHTESHIASASAPNGVPDASLLSTDSEALERQDAREVEEDDEKVDASARHLLSMLLNEADSDE